MTPTETAIQRDINNTFTVLLENINAAISDSKSYGEMELEAHYKKFPADRNSVFVKNLIYKVLSDQDHLLYQANSLIDREARYYKTHGYVFDSDIKNVLQLTKQILSTVLSKTDTAFVDRYGIGRYTHLHKAIQENENLIKLESQPKVINSKPSTSNRINWKILSPDIWVTEYEGYPLTVQFYNGYYYGTVKDISNFRVYSISTPYQTREQAIEATIEFADEKRKNNTSKTKEAYMRDEYKPIYQGKQGRLF